MTYKSTEFYSFENPLFRGKESDDVLSNKLENCSFRSTKNERNEGSTVPKYEKERILVVSNRLPSTISKSPEGHYEYGGSSGGLVSGLLGIKKTNNFKWIGWPGTEIPDGDKAKVYSDLMRLHNSVPVFLSEKLIKFHYGGFSNS